MQLGPDKGSYIQNMAIQSDDKIVAVGSAISKAEFVVTRFNANGTLDSTFGTNGGVVYWETDFNWSDADAIAIQTDGKIIAAGYYCGGYNGVNPDFALIRLWP
jgi:uncharacterized delta-60 repeat protein